MGKIDDANREAYERMEKGAPAVTDIVYAKDVLPDIDKYTIGHAGPPTNWEHMCGPMRGAVMTALVYEGLASDNEEAAELAASGKIKFRPNHDCGSVGPMAGVTTYTMPLLEITNEAFGNKVYIGINEGDIRAMCFGSDDPVVIPRLNWFRDEFAPYFKEALADHGPVSLRPIVAQALTMGEDEHNRTFASSAIFYKEITPSLVKVIKDHDALERIMNFMAGNDYFFLALSMAYGKAIADTIKNIPNCTIVSTMSRNGTDFGIKVSALGERWFTAPCPPVIGLYFPGFSEKDANPDIGDSCITETVGLGGLSMGAAPSLINCFNEDDVEAAYAITREMLEITEDVSKDLVLPPMNFQGIPMGIDIRKVIETGIQPVINTGIAHKDPHFGQIGVGISRAPMECFTQALAAFAEEYGV
ncbi:MAG: DUF1116 domain-containing protein [Atopobiaceae bacterium]|nr:DUF1116 domain-containing protein [Atopobiaceae bacterium]